MSQFKFDDILSHWEHQKAELNKNLAENAKTFFVDKFDQQEWNNKPWVPAKDEHTPLLIRTGRLRSDLNNSISKVDNDGYTIDVNTPYGGFHNSGTRSLPQRQFVGADKELDKNQMEIISEAIDKIFKP